MTVILTPEGEIVALNNPNAPRPSRKWRRLPEKVKRRLASEVVRTGKVKPVQTRPYQFHPFVQNTKL